MEGEIGLRWVGERKLGRIFFTSLCNNYYISHFITTLVKLYKGFYEACQILDAFFAAFVSCFKKLWILG